MFQRAAPQIYTHTRRPAHNAYKQAGNTLDWFQGNREDDEVLAREREMDLAWVDPADLMHQIANGWAATMARRFA